MIYQLQCDLYDKQLCVCVSRGYSHLQFLSEMVGDNGSKGGEQGSQEDTNITDVNSDVEKM